MALGSGFHKAVRAAKASMAIVMPNSLLSTQGPFKVTALNSNGVCYELNYVSPQIHTLKS